MPHRGKGRREFLVESSRAALGFSLFPFAAWAQRNQKSPALKLCEKGIIGLDIPLTKYAPKPFLEGDPRLERITDVQINEETKKGWFCGVGRRPL